MQRKYKLNIITTEMQEGIHGASMMPEGTKEVTVFINSTMTAAEQAATFLHECLHLWHEDHSSGGDVNAIEAARHAEIIDLLEILKQREESQE